jgi:hypothetical protein
MPPEPQNTPKLSPPIFIWILIIAAALIGSIQIWQASLQKVVEVSKPLETTTRTDNIYDWEVYRNTVLGFEFRYPKTWEIHIDANFINPETGVANDEVRSGKIYSSLIIDLVKKDSNLLPITISHTRLDYDDYSIDDQRRIVCAPDKCRENRYGVEYIRENNDLHDKGFEMSALIPTGKYIIGVSPNINVDTREKLERPTGQNKEIIETFDQILSTFKFISTSTTNISEHKTYRNEKYGFEVIYPTTFDDAEEGKLPVCAVEEGGDDVYHVYFQYPDCRPRMWEVLTRIEIINSKFSTLDDYVNDPHNGRMQTSANLSKEKTVFQGYPAYKIHAGCGQDGGACIATDYYVLHKDNTNLVFEIFLKQTGYRDGQLLYWTDIDFKFTK